MSFFLESGDQAIETVLGANEIALQRIDTTLGRIGVTRCLQAAVEFGLYETGIFDELDDLVPHYRIEEVLADRTIVADRATRAPPRV